MEEQKKVSKENLFNYLRVGFVLVAILAAIIWVCQKQDGVARYVILWQSFVKMGPVFFAGILAAFILSQVILASRWWLLLRTQAVYIKIWAAIRLHFLGLFYNNCIPGSVGGDLVRAWYVTKHTERKFEAALSVFVDRFIALISSLIMAGFCWFVLLDVKLPAGKKKAFSLIILWAIAVIVAAAVLVAIFPAGRRLYSKAYRLCVEMAKKFWTAVVIYGKNPLTILACFGLTILLQSIVITGFWLIGRQIGIEVSAKYYFVFFPLTWGFGAIPVSIGGAGVVEFGLAGLFVIVGVESGQAFALALLQRAVWIVASLPGAWIHWTGRHLPKDMQIEPAEE
jgi:glycosyltransferase 2 family protein